jgi:hypothetical protein
MGFTEVKIVLFTRLLLFSFFLLMISSIISNIFYVLVKNISNRYKKANLRFFSPVVDILQ